jgi:hypothetical protein
MDWILHTSIWATHYTQSDFHVERREMVIYTHSCRLLANVFQFTDLQRNKLYAKSKRRKQFLLVYPN